MKISRSGVIFWKNKSLDSHDTTLTVYFENYKDTFSEVSRATTSELFRMHREVIDRLGEYHENNQ